MEVNGLKIKEYRAKKGLTQEEFANVIGVTTMSIRNYESGKPIPRGRVRQIENIINCSEKKEAGKDDVSKLIHSVNELTEQNGKLITIIEHLTKNENHVK